MSAKGGSPLTTFLFSIPLAAIPLMAIFGIPQFAPVVASPDDADDFETSSASRDPDYRRRASDLMQPYDDRGLSEPLSDAPSYDAGNGTDVDLGGGSDSIESFDRPSGLPDSAPPSEASVFGEPSSGLEPDARTDPFEPDSGWSEEEGSAAATPDAARSSAGRMTWRQASGLLREMGIDDYHLEPGAAEGSFLFVCSLTPAGASNVTMRFEAESEDPLLAVGDVLGQVDRWLKQRYAQSREPAPVR